MRSSFRAAALAAFTLAASGAFMPSARAHAQDASADARRYRATYYSCAKQAGDATAALNACIAAEHDYQDKRLNTAYQSLRKVLDEKQRTALRDEEREWITARDKACTPGKDGSTLSLDDPGTCMLGRTADRARELEERAGM